jgi:RNA polymerase sigma-70 factor (ECF subfamily)
MLAAVTDRGRTGEGDFDDFYASEYGRIVALAYALTGDRGAAEDAAQDAFLAAHRDWDRVGRYDAPGAWVRRAVVNRSRSRFRRRGRESSALARVAASELASTEPSYDESEDFWRAVRALPPKLARCVVLHYVDDLDAAAIADVLGIAPSTVRVHLHRARLALAQSLGLEEDA